jgi:hypothetical protein
MDGMDTINKTYFSIDRMKKDARLNLVIVGVVLAIAGGVLVLQSFKFISSIPVLLAFGRELWWEYLRTMLKIMIVWAFIVGITYGMVFGTHPSIKDGKGFLAAVFTGFAIGFLVPYTLILGSGILLFIPLGLLSLFIEEIIQYATLQFTWLLAACIVFIWVIAGMPPLLLDMLKDGHWYLKLMALLLFCYLILDVLLVTASAMQILSRNSLWRMNLPFLLAELGSLFLTIVVVLLSLRGQRVLTIVYAISGIYVASIATGNLSNIVFDWGEMPSAILALLAPLLYLQVTKWILKNQLVAVAGLIAGLAGLLVGLFIAQFVHMRIIGQGWSGLLCGTGIALGFGLSFGFIFGPRITNLLASKINFKPVVIKYLDLGLIAGIITGTVMGGFLAR